MLAVQDDAAVSARTGCCGLRKEVSTFLLGLTCATLVALTAGCGSSEHPFVVDTLAPPSWSPDGTSIAYEASGDIYVTELGGRTSRLTDLKEHQLATEPTWSPDGRKIAYDVGEVSQVNGYFFIDRTVLRDLVRGRSVTVSRHSDYVGGSCHAWSPDGKKIVLLTGTDLNVMDVDRGGLERLGRADSAVDSCPAWSPDGRWLAYACCHAGNTWADVRLIELGTHRVQRLTRGAYAGKIAWSPDGKQILFETVTDSATGIGSIEPDGTGSAFITDDRNYADDPAWSPDSRKIAYRIGGGSQNDTLIVADRDGDNPRVVARGVCCLRWSPLGEKLAFVKNDTNGTAALYVMDADGKGLVKASSPPASDTHD